MKGKKVTTFSIRKVKPHTLLKFVALFSFPVLSKTSSLVRETRLLEISTFSFVYKNEHFMLT